MIFPVMSKSTPKDLYSVNKYNELHYAVTQFGTSMHREFWNMMVDAGFNKQQIFRKYMKMLRNVNTINTHILKWMDSKD